VDHPAPGGHPKHVAGPKHSLIAIACLALDGEGHNFESSMRVRATRAPAWRKIETVVCQDDERIVVRKVSHVDHVNRRVALADESRSWRRKRDHLRESTYCR
jgi:hypothetical protein